MSDTVEQAQELLLRVEKECKGVGLMLNSKKTKSMFLNVDVEQLKNEVGEVILQALTESGDQKIFSTWDPGVTRIERDIKTRKAFISVEITFINKMDKIWKSKIDERLKIMLFLEPQQRGFFCTDPKHGR